jgi:hypothetical protein
MPELQFNRKDIEDLARKVGTLEPYLSEQEHALLLAIFAAASERATPRTRAATLPTAETEHPTREAGTPRHATFGDLHQQLLDAYVAGPDRAEGGFLDCITRTEVPPNA